VRIIDYQLKKQIVPAWIAYRDLHKELHRPEPVSGVRGFLAFGQWAFLVGAVLAAGGAIAGVNRNGFALVVPLLIAAAVSFLLVKGWNSKDAKLRSQMTRIETEMQAIGVRFQGLTQGSPVAHLIAATGTDAAFDPLDDEAYG
jgi:hypothetical protein